MLFDLIVQSPLNKKRFFTIPGKSQRSKPERTTAFPPARNAVLIQAESKKRSRQQTHKKPPGMVKKVA